MWQSLPYISKKELFATLRTETDLTGIENLAFQRLSKASGRIYNDNYQFIIYGNSLVFENRKGIIKLYTDNYHTVTTKKWINYGLQGTGKYIMQKNYEWYLIDNEAKIPFVEGITI